MSTQTMHAAVLEQFNQPLTQTRIERPQPPADQVLVRVRASGVNPLDLKIRSGAAAHARHPLGSIPGIDLAGVVETVGADVHGFKPGDDVYGMTGGVGGIQGSLAEFVAVDPRLLALKPATLDMRQAAALPLVVITAWEGLVDRAHLQAGQRVLIHGGAGGVGHVAIQIAKALGAEVFATGKAGQAQLIKSLGATAIDYQTTTTAEYVEQYTQGRGFDVVYDTVGGATLDASFAAVKRFGHVVSALGWGTHALAPLSFKAATYSGVFTLLPLLTGEGQERHGEILQQAAVMAERGLLKPLLDPRAFVLAEVEQAYALLESGGNQGKLVISL